MKVWVPEKEIVTESTAFVRIVQAMAMGHRAKQREQQTDFWIAHTELPRTVGHPFYERLNQVLAERGFDAFVERQCERFYAETMGRPSLTPGRYFRLLLIGYFEGLDGERGIAWRAADSLALRQFLEFELSEQPPDHSTISRTRRLIDVETHQAVFGWVLELLAEKGLLKGKTVGIDATTLEANAAMRSIVRRDTGEGYEEFLRRLARGLGDRDADAGAVGEAGPQAGEEGVERRLGESARSGRGDHQDEGRAHASGLQGGACGGLGDGRGGRDHGGYG